MRLTNLVDGQRPTSYQVWFLIIVITYLKFSLSLKIFPHLSQPFTKTNLSNQIKILTIGIEKCYLYE